jgi:hypothetical protein
VGEWQLGMDVRRSRPALTRTKNRDCAAKIRQLVADLIEESECLQKEVGQLRIAGLALIKYLERLAAGKTAGFIQGEEVRAAIETIRSARS